jgi:voltage-gated potassium channel
MNKKMKIISKVTHQENINKLSYAGADKVIPIQEIGAHRMVSMMLNPTIIGFLDSISQSGSLQLRFEEVKVPRTFTKEGMSMEALKIPQKNWLDSHCDSQRWSQQVQPKRFDFSEARRQSYGAR